MRYLLDTSAILGHVYGDRATAGLLHHLHDSGGELFTTDVVIAEALSRGDERHRELIGRLLDSLTYISITPEIAREAAEVQRTTGCGLAESLLEAAARSIQGTLVRLQVHRAGA